MYDLLIEKAKIIDGTGDGAFWGDVAIANGKIAEIGYTLGQARRKIDASGLLLCPFFL